MERYYSDDPDQDNDPYFDPDGDDSEQEAVAFMDQQGIIDVMHVDLAQIELNQELLDTALRIARDSFFWKFKSMKTKLAEIQVIYEKLVEITGYNDLPPVKKEG